MFTGSESERDPSRRLRNEEEHGRRACHVSDNDVALELLGNVVLVVAVLVVIFLLHIAVVSGYEAYLLAKVIKHPVLWQTSSSFLKRTQPCVSAVGTMTPTPLLADFSGGDYRQTKVHISRAGKSARIVSDTNPMKTDDLGLW